MNILSIVIMMIFIIIPIITAIVYTALAKSIPLAVFFLALIGVSADFIDFNFSICVLLCAVPISLTMGYVLKKSFSTYDGLLLTVLSFGLSLILIIIYLNFVVGQDVVGDVRNLIDTIVSQTIKYSMLPSGFTRYQFEYALEGVISTLVPLYCLICGFASYCFTRNLAARKNIVLPMKKFSELVLPKNAVTGLAITIFAAILGTQLDIPNVGFISNVLSISVCTVFAISGLALLSYVLNAAVKYSFLRGFVLAVSLLFLGWPLAIFGILGPMLNVRGRIKP